MPEIVAPGDRLGERYRLDGPLGAGGMATVWRAVDLVLDRSVAVKVPREGWPEQFTRRLRQEATLGFDFPDGQAITQLWNGSQAQNGPSVTVTSADWNRSIPPDGTAEFGFLGRQDGPNAPPPRFILNGAECRP